MTKLFFIFSVCFILLFTLLPQANPAADDPVNIPDAALRTIIEDKLGKDAGDTITEAEMNGITGLLDASTDDSADEDIVDLTGLEEATGVTDLHLNHNKITDLSPLSGLTQLTILRLNQNPITDLSPLQNLTNLEELYLNKLNEAGGGLVDVSPLAGLTALKALHLQDNNITDISSLTNLTALEDLKLSTNKELSNISVVRNFTNLEQLWLNYTRITDDDIEEVLPELSSLDALHLSITTITLPVLAEHLHASATLSRLYLDYMLSDWEKKDYSYQLKDISLLVDLMNSGQIGGVSDLYGDPIVYLRGNWILDYESLFTHIPALIAGMIGVRYPSVDVQLERVSAENHVGRPGTQHTFVVRTANTGVQLSKVPVTFSVDGTSVATETTDANGLAEVTITLGEHGETRTVTAVVPANAPTNGPQHNELSVSFTATADNTAPIPPGLRVMFRDYPENQPIETFPLTIVFSEPVTDFQNEDITVETQLTTGTGTATLEALTPTADPAQTYTARIRLPTDAAGNVRLIVAGGAAFSVARAIGPTADTASELIRFGPHDKESHEDIYPRRPPALVVTQIDFAKGMFSVQNTTQYRFNVEMKIYSEDHRDKWFKVSERALIAIEDAKTLTFSLTPVETDDASIQHLNSERLLSQNQNQPLELSAEKFCIKLIRGIPVDIASNMPEDLRFTDPRWAPPGDVIFRQYDAGWDVKLQGMRRDHLVYRRFPLDGRLLDSWDVEVSVAAAPSISRGQVQKVFWKWADVKHPDSQKIR